MSYIKTNYKIWLAFLHDIFMSTAAFLIALALRYSITEYNFFERIPNLPEKLLILLVVQLAFFIYFGLYRGIWRFSSTHDLKQLIKASFCTTIFTYIAFELTNNREMIPRSSLFIYFNLLVLMSGGGRFLYRIYKESIKKNIEANALIIGAGNAAEKLIRDFQKQQTTNYNIVGLIDDDKLKKNRTIHGKKVIGNIEQISQICIKHNIKKVFIAIPSAYSIEMRRIINECNKIPNIDVKTLPSVHDIIDGKVSVSALRNVDPIDLLGRKPADLDIETIGKMLTNKTILLSGAGGSIGSELARQIIKFSPKKVILVDVSEFFLYEISRELQKYNTTTQLISKVACVKNRQRMDKIFMSENIDIIYHAAAYKQVPLMEDNPSESIETNIFGTKNLAEMAVKYKVKNFVMISTDKAVNPTNVMGTTKRIAEMVCQNISKQSNCTKFTTVRFGNVLGSNGSVIPLFKEQIKEGGPVTVTHKEITRFFMSIQEAAQLVLQAGSMGNGGEIFVLDMGEPIKIFEFAKQMIRLSGYEPFVDIDIEITGLRPGEKLYEELLANNENTLSTPHSSIRVACSRDVAENLDSKLSSLKDSLFNLSNNEIKLLLQNCVSEYTPDLERPSSTIQFTT